MIKTIEWTDEGVVMIDQRRLPAEEIYNTYTTVEEVAKAIVTMVIRGAPAIGVAAAMGIALGVKNLDNDNNIESDFEKICRTIQSTRPTAKNLFWAISRMKKLFSILAGKVDLESLKKSLVNEAIAVYREDIEINRRIGEHGHEVLSNGDTVLTHCNAGALATAGYGTALGVIRSAVEAGKSIHVFADETRPFLQGARLTAWELAYDNIPCTLITDSMAGWFMKLGKINAVVVGADRIAPNGDAANKIGTYSVAVLAKAHKIPFYVAAPISTFDPEISTGEEIPIEQRDTREVSEINGHVLAPENIQIENPAFDVTPESLISGIITEYGIARPPYSESIADFFRQSGISGISAI
ncbi:MAG: S-methyl-5-thioribose-1-phosphate isomerase [Acidobacteriota bacterium]